MASLAAAESLLLVDNSQMPYHGNQRIQPNDTSSRPAQVHCDRYDDVVDLITQVDLAGKTYFSHYADQGMIIARVVAVFKRPKNADKIAVFDGVSSAWKISRSSCIAVRRGCRRIRRPERGGCSDRLAGHAVTANTSSKRKRVHFLADANGMRSLALRACIHQTLVGLAWCIKGNFLPAACQFPKRGSQSRTARAPEHRNCSEVSRWIGNRL